MATDSSHGSITRLIPGVRTGDRLAIEQLWKRYVLRVEGLARPLMSGLAPGAGDVEDVAQSTFDAFFTAAAEGRAPELASRDELWRLLAAISRRKATDRVRRELRQRRGGGARNEHEALPGVAGASPTPSKAAALQELLDQLMARLDASGDPRLKTIAVLRLEGADTQEIAEQLDCTVRTVQRKLHILERLWTSPSQ